MKNINALFTIPKPFESTDLSLWQDPYISEKLLVQHLNPHIDNASRNHHFIDQSSQWILSHLKTPSSILDLGCGPGLYTKVFSEALHNVLGIDFSQRSIDYARTHSGGHFDLQDYTNLHLDGQFDLVSMIHCEYGSLSKVQRQTLLKTIHTHLNYDGLLILDVFTLNAFKEFTQRQTWAHHTSPSFFSDQEHIEITLDKKYDNAISLRQSIIIANDEQKTYRQWYQYFNLHTLRSELLESGFEIIHYYDNLLGEAVSSHSNTLAVVARKIL